MKSHRNLSIYLLCNVPPEYLQLFHHKTNLFYDVTQKKIEMNHYTRTAGDTDNFTLNVCVLVVGVLAVNSTFRGFHADDQKDESQHVCFFLASYM